MATGYDQLERLLARSIGLDPAALGESNLRRAVDRRRRALGMNGGDAGEYLRRACTSTEELQELVEELVVPETWFFRDGRPFEVLRSHAAAWLGTEGAGRGAFRALSVPCSSGEEPYSIALTLLELGLPRDRFTIDAIDISARAVERARRGVYGPRSLRTIDAALRERYFRAQAGGVEINPEVRDCVRFLQGNLLDSEALRAEPPYDVIFCRNLLIYLNMTARERAIEILDRLLAPNGLLFVGHAERLPLLEPRFAARGAPGSFCYERALRKALEGPSATRTSPGGRARTGHGQGLARKPDGGPPAVAVTAARRGSPDAIASPVAAPAPSDPLAEALTLANRHEYDRAAALCEQWIARSGPSAEAFRLLGAIRQATGDLADAERWLSKAVYLDADDEDALLALALIAGRRGDRSAAERYRRRAERARKRKAQP